MNKNQAAEAIDQVRLSFSRYSESQAKIREILDQIDQPPQEFSVRHACELIGKSPTVGFVRLFGDGTSSVGTTVGPNCDCSTIDELKSKLIELATPPKPTTVAVELPIYWAKGYVLMYPDGNVGKSMRGALAKLEQQHS